MAGSVATGGGTGGALSAIGDVAKLLESNYRKTTPRRLRMLDMFLVFVFATGVLQVRAVQSVKPLGSFAVGGRLFFIKCESRAALFMRPTKLPCRSFLKL